MGRRYFCTRNEKADSSPVLTRSMASTSAEAASVVALELAAEGLPAKFSRPPLDERALEDLPPSNPRSTSPVSKAMLLTSVETPSGAESCVSSEADGGAEVVFPESVTGRASGVSEATMKGRCKEAIGSGGTGQEASQPVYSSRPAQTMREGSPRIMTTSKTMSNQTASNQTPSNQAPPPHVGILQILNGAHVGGGRFRAWRKRESPIYWKTVQNRRRNWPAKSEPRRT